MDKDEGMDRTCGRAAPKGGHAGWLAFGVFVLALALMVLTFFISVALFPDLPQRYPFIGAIVAMATIGSWFEHLNRPVCWPRMIRFVAAAGVTAWASALAVATLLGAVGWTGSGATEFIFGIGVTTPLVFAASHWLFKAMIKRHDGPPEKEVAR